ncbi:MAG TPA: hypothetical protein VHP83_00095 [Aggregatilineaceae bacterium]|nr:hypothetical protein [Aggregatilineaceae bacterium]
MLIVAGLMLFAYGYTLYSFKDFWWWDYALLFNALGKKVTRTAAWERQHSLTAAGCMVAGVILSFYAVGMLL